MKAFILSLLSLLALSLAKGPNAVKGLNDFYSGLLSVLDQEPHERNHNNAEYHPKSDPKLVLCFKNANRPFGLLYQQFSNLHLDSKGVASVLTTMGNFTA